MRYVLAVITLAVLISKVLPQSLIDYDANHREQIEAEAAEDVAARPPVASSVELLKLYFPEGRK